MGLYHSTMKLRKYFIKSGREVFVLANKSDNDERDNLITEFTSLGFPVYAVSALQNRGIDTILDVIIKNFQNHGV